jgi:hypothetical protein
MQATDALFLSLSQIAEHLVVAVIGLFIAYMGYRLFREMPVQREGQAKIGLPGGISIFFSRVGPGAFFVLFGTGLIGYTTTRPMTYEQRPELVRFSGHGFSDQSLPGERVTSRAPRDPVGTGMPRPGLVRALAELDTENESTPLSAKHIERAAALRAARIQIMLADWDPNWGSQQDFLRWTESVGGAPPANAQRAVAVFSGQDQ